MKAIYELPRVAYKVRGRPDVKSTHYALDSSQHSDSVDSTAHNHRSNITSCANLPIMITFPTISRLPPLTLRTIAITLTTILRRTLHLPIPSLRGTALLTRRKATHAPLRDRLSIPDILRRPFTSCCGLLLCGVCLGGIGHCCSLAELAAGFLVGLHVGVFAFVSVSRGC